MGCKIENKKIYHLKCDICGIEEDIIETDRYSEYSWKNRPWSSCEFNYHIPYDKRKVKSWERRRKTVNLCPECTKKFKKLMKNVVFQEE